jgi:hypothetical protein
MARLSAGLLVLVFGALGTTRVLALAEGPGQSRSEVQDSSAGTAPARVTTTRDERDGRAVERTTVEGPSTRGEASALAETVATTRRGETTTERTRNEYVIGANGGLQLASTVAERRVDRPDGGRRIVRDFSEPDANNRLRPTRREQEDTVAQADGRFRTIVEIAQPSVNGSLFTTVERTERLERREGEELVDLESTTWTDPAGNGRWEAIEQRVLSRDTSGGSARSVETVYKTDGNGNLVESRRIETRERTEPGGREIRTQNIVDGGIGQVGGPPARPFQQRIEAVRTPRADGSWTATRTVSEMRDGRLQVVERVVERARPDGRGGTVIEEETERLDVNGRLQTVRVSRTNESAP